jgi:hypothetical protein
VLGPGLLALSAMLALKTKRFGYSPPSKRGANAAARGP